MCGKRQLSASATSAASGELLFTYNEHGWATDGCMDDDVQTGGGDLPKDHNNQLMMCHMPCSLHMWLLLHRGFKGAFTLPKEFYSVFASFYAYTHMDAEITSPVYF